MGTNLTRTPRFASLFVAASALALFAGSASAQSQSNTSAVAAPAVSAPRAATRCMRWPPAPGPAQGFRHMSNRVRAGGERAAHRGIDQVVRAGDAQWLVGRFMYGQTDAGLRDEDVAVYVMRDCRRWELMGTARTTGDASQSLVINGQELGRRQGQVLFRVPDAARLGAGLHRVRFVVRADNSAVDAFVNVLSNSTRFVVSDVDGTLIQGETTDTMHRLGGRTVPAPNPGAQDALWALARQGYQVMYLTGRAEWTTADTRVWLESNGFPPGVLRTRPNAGIGIGGPDVQQYKTEQLRALTRVLGHAPDYAFGNTPTDVGAYTAAGINPSRAFYYQNRGDLRGGQFNGDYRVLAARFAGSAPSTGGTATLSAPAAR